MTANTVCIQTRKVQGRSGGLFDVELHAVSLDDERDAFVLVRRDTRAADDAQWSTQKLVRGRELLSARLDERGHVRAETARWSYPSDAEKVAAALELGIDPLLILSGPARRAVRDARRAGIERLEDFAGRSWHELRRFRGMGSGFLRSVREMLRAAGHPDLTL